MISSGLLPKFSPRIVTLVPGGPSFGETPVTTGSRLIFAVVGNSNHTTIALEIHVHRQVSNKKQKTGQVCGCV